LGIQIWTARRGAEIVLPVDRATGRNEAARVQFLIPQKVVRHAWKLLVPDLETKVMMPPPACPYSALNPLVSIANSVIASSDGALYAISVAIGVRLVATDTPSSVASQARVWPPPGRAGLPLPRASGVIDTRSNGLRNAPLTTRGNSSTSLFCTLDVILAFSVWTCAAVGADLHRVADLPHFEPRVGAKRGRRRQHDAVVHVFLKPFAENSSDTFRAAVGQVVIACVRGGRSGGLVGREVGDHHRGAG